MSDLREPTTISAETWKGWYDLCQKQNAALRDIISKALSELGVPTPDYPANVANAVRILQTAWPDAPAEPAQPPQEDWIERMPNGKPLAEAQPPQEDAVTALSEVLAALWSEGQAGMEPVSKEAKWVLNRLADSGWSLSHQSQKP